MIYFSNHVLEIILDANKCTYRVFFLKKSNLRFHALFFYGRSFWSGGRSLVSVVSFCGFVMIDTLVSSWTRIPLVAAKLDQTQEPLLFNQTAAQTCQAGCIGDSETSYPAWLYSFSRLPPLPTCQVPTMDCVRAVKHCTPFNPSLIVYMDSVYISYHQTTFFRKKKV